MTENEWLSSRDAGALLRWHGRAKAHGIGGDNQPYRLRPSDRKVRLFAVACWRDEPVVDHFCKTLDLAERLAEGQAKGDLVSRVAWPRSVLSPDPWEAAEGAITYAEGGRNAHWLLEVLGNPFRLPKGRVAWWRRANNRAALLLALAAYKGRDWAILPVLADALEDVGCADDFLLGHLRGPGPHCLGCWALDFVLGKK